MSAGFARHLFTSSHGGGAGTRAALLFARNAYAALDRRMPEAAALVTWLSQNAASFGLPDSAVPSDDVPRRSRRHGVPLPDWRRAGAALAQAAAALPEDTASVAETWLSALGQTLDLDALERGSSRWRCTTSRTTGWSSCSTN